MRNLFAKGEIRSLASRAGVIRSPLSLRRNLSDATKATKTSPGVKGGAGGAAGIASPAWSWVPPSKQLPPKQNIAAIEKELRDLEKMQASPLSSVVGLSAIDSSSDSDVIPVKLNVLLTSAEIVEALTKMGGIDVKTVSVGGKLGNVEDFIIATGSSARHIRKMSQAVVQALKSRNLKSAMGFTGAEGDKDDDWLLIDCDDRVVHLMLPQTRKALALEAHWAAENKRPEVIWSPNESLYEANFNLLLEQHPVPEEWDAAADEAAELRDTSLSAIAKESEQKKKHGTNLGEL